MKYVIFEESKQLVYANVISKTQDNNYLYVELSSGKQSKIKAKDVLYSFNNSIDIKIIHEIDLQLLWDFAPEQATHVQELCAEYFGQITEQNIYSILYTLYKNPIYFSKKGQGYFIKANQEQLNIALNAIAKRKIQDDLQQHYKEQLLQGILPDNFKKIALELLFNPNKNSIEWKASETVAKELNVEVQALLINLKAIENAKIYHEQLFFREYFPKGVNFNANIKYTMPFKLENLEQNTHLQVFSIDDSSTTEIDDAFSIEFNSEGFELGIHIAAPALGINIGDEIETIARQRLSTVYFPHDKITMLPPNIVETFSLDENKICPAVSLYIQVDNSFNIISYITKINAIKIAKNLRYDKLEHIINEQTIQSDIQDENIQFPYKKELTTLWQFANQLYNQRQVMRQNFGLRPENNNQIDYSFNISYENDIEKVEIKKRQRGSPLDKIVSELMILANSTWAKNLDDVGLSAMFRTQKSWGTMRTRMQSSIAPHEGLGVEGYVWATSPLRRYSDMVNQWQIVAFAQHGNTAKLVAPFNQKEHDINYLINIFTDTYAGYHDYQTKMERYWCIRWLDQEQKTYATGTLGREGNIKFDDIPFSIKLPELAQHPRGSIISLEIGQLDEVNLTAKVRVLNINATA